LTPLSGNVTFLTSQTTAQIAIAITNDAVSCILSNVWSRGV
jgi:hypothetical protein